MEKQPSRKALMEKIAALEANLRKAQQDLKRESARQALVSAGRPGGKDAFRQLEALDPDVRAIVSSGYSNDPVMANYAHYGFRGAVKSPIWFRR
jgi:hypothetical protein